MVTKRNFILLFFIIPSKSAVFTKEASVIVLEYIVNYGGYFKKCVEYLKIGEIFYESYL